MISPRGDVLIRYLAACGAFDIDGMLAPSPDDVRFAHHARDEPAVAIQGRDAFHALAEPSRGLFHEQRANGWQFDTDRAIVDIDDRGTLTQNLDGGSTTHTMLELKARSESGFAGDCIVFLAAYS